jgi:hypothetical protein
MTLQKYRVCENFIIVGVVEDGRLFSFAVADRNMELVSSKRFDIANDAFDWAELNYKGLV